MTLALARATELPAALLAHAAPIHRAGLLEVRGVGIVPEPTAPAPVALALDLAAVEEEVRRELRGFLFL